MNPVKENQDIMGYLQIAQATGFSRQYIWHLSGLSDYKMSRLPLLTVLKLERATGLDLHRYAKEELDLTNNN